jgi:hypothetical protein
MLWLLLVMLLVSLVLMHVYGYGWDRQLMKKKQEVLQGARFFTVTADEVMTIDRYMGVYDALLR